MRTYKLTYARVVYLNEYIEAINKEDALNQAWDLEARGKLGLGEVKAKPGSEISSIEDYDVVWEVEEICVDTEG